MALESSSVTNPNKTLGQAVVWTVLPQGWSPNSTTATPTVRLSVLVTPRLSFTETVGSRTSNSTELSTFTDWVNWPQTMADSNITFEFNFEGVDTPVPPVNQPDITLLNGAFWTAMLGANTTRVDSSYVEDWSKKVTNGFSVGALHDAITQFYGSYAAGITNFPQLLSIQGGAPVTPGAAAKAKRARRSGPDITTPPPPGVALYAYNQMAASLNVPEHFTNALQSHVAPMTPTPPVTTVPIQDFHAAVSSLGAYPELLQTFGLLFPLEVVLPAGPAGGGQVNVSVTPSWQSSFAQNVEVCPQTACTITTGTSPLFLATPSNSGTGAVYADGMLDLGNVNGAATPTFTVVDMDVDGAVEGLFGYQNSLVAALEPYLGPDAELDAEIPMTLPRLRSVGPSLVWSGFGTTAADGSDSGLDALASNQATIGTNIDAFITQGTPLPAPLQAEDITRGWRIDVRTVEYTPGVSPLQISGYGPWQSLHWRQASYAFGTGGAYQLPASTATLQEGLVTPGASFTPPIDTERPPSVTVQQMTVHEVIARWNGWSLSAPRPGNQINEDITTTPAAGNPMPPTSITDRLGNYNAQIQAEFTIPPAGLSISDPDNPDLVLGTTGLPPLRFGQTYQYRARAVDLGGWSLPQSWTGGSITPPSTHFRWEPVAAPQVVPTAPLTPGEGVFTIVIRNYSNSSIPSTTNARWLFPPRVHQLMAEEHGFFDLDGVPNANGGKTWTVIDNFNDGSLNSLPGMKQGATGVSGVANLYHPLNTSSGGGVPPVAVSWLPDPAAFGLAIGGAPIAAVKGYNGPLWTADNGIVTPTTGFPTAAVIPAKDLGGDKSANYVDAWVNSSQKPTNSDAWLNWQAHWPAQITGKVFEVVPTTAAPVLPQTTQAQPVFSVTAATAASAPVYTLTVVPGSVYVVPISSLYSAEMGVAASSGLGALGLENLFLGVIPPEGFNSGQKIDAFTGSVGLLTPPVNLLVVYAVLLPELAPAFSQTKTVLSRSPNSTTLGITDSAFVVDPASTSHVTFSSTWKDIIDNPALPAPTTQTIVQGSLVADVWDPYPSPVPVDPLVAVPTNQTSPFGEIVHDVSNVAANRIGLFATQQIGDTKHHEATYTATAASRFAEFFVTSSTVTFTEGTPYTINATGIDPNIVTIILPASSHGPAVTIPTNMYKVNGPAGQITLADGAIVTQGTTGIPLFNAQLEVNWVPTNTLTGKPYTPVHIPSTSTPPPLKVARVVPAWNLSSTGSVSASDFILTRTGNTLRVYLERPWYLTGLNEMVGVVSAYQSGAAATPGIPPNVNPSLTSLIGFDPISVPAPNPDSSIYTQAQLKFVTPANVPNTATLTGGNPVYVPIPQDADALRAVYAYVPIYDPVDQLWFVDVQLDPTSFPTELTPGYFLQLALVRFQPYSTGGEVYTDPTTGLDATTPSNWTSPISTLTLAQPVPDRNVLVTTGPNNTVEVSVTGPAYYGWRPSYDGEIDANNEFATHPNSLGSSSGAPVTSTMVVEVQEYNPTLAGGFTGDFGWITHYNLQVNLTPNFGSSQTPVISWGSNPTSSSGGVALPSTSNAVRLCISEVDFQGQVGQGVDTTLRRSFVVHIPVSGTQPS